MCQLREWQCKIGELHKCYTLTDTVRWGSANRYKDQTVSSHSSEVSRPLVAPLASAISTIALNAIEFIHHIVEHCCNGASGEINVSSWVCIQTSVISQLHWKLTWPYLYIQVWTPILTTFKFMSRCWTSESKLGKCRWWRDELGELAPLFRFISVHAQWKYTW